MKESRLPIWIKSKIGLIVFSCIPLFCSIIFAALQGIALWEIDPFASLWNDEVFYHEQIEAMIKYGAPLGYFGYNGSTAQVGTLGAWPEFILYPYVLLGSIFGMSPYHMIGYNVLIMMLAFGIFYVLAKPEKWQCVIIALLFFTFPANMRYLMSGMVEALYNAVIIVLVGFLVYFQRGKYNRISLGIAYFLVFYFAVSRPWLLIFVFIPAGYHFKISKKESILASLITMGAFAITYVFFAMPRCAPYLYAHINMQIFGTLLEDGIFAFIKEVITTTVQDGIVLLGFMFSFKTFYAASLFTFFILLIMVFLFVIIKRKQLKTWKDEKIITALMVLFVCVCIIWAMIIFYTEEQISRHIMSVIIALEMLVVMCFLPKKKPIIVGMTVLFFLIGWQYSGDAYTFMLPQETGTGSIVKEEAKALETAFTAVESENPWENTVLYVYPNVNTNYCYYLPEGVGLSLCVEPYVNEVYTTTEAKYILTNYNDGTYAMYTEWGWEVIAQGQQFVLYEKK